MKTLFNPHLFHVTNVIMTQKLNVMINSLIAVPFIEGATKIFERAKNGEKNAHSRPVYRRR